MSVTRLRRLIPVSAIFVEPGDEVEVDGVRVPVTNNVRGSNGQRYLVTESRGGAIVVHECDPRQTVSVWR